MGGHQSNRQIWGNWTSPIGRVNGMLAVTHTGPGFGALDRAPRDPDHFVVRIPTPLISGEDIPGFETFDPTEGGENLPQKSQSTCCPWTNGKEDHHKPCEVEGRAHRLPLLFFYHPAACPWAPIKADREPGKSSPKSLQEVWSPMDKALFNRFLSSRVFTFSSGEGFSIDFLYPRRALSRLGDPAPSCIWSSPALLAWLIPQSIACTS